MLSGKEDKVDNEILIKNDYRWSDCCLFCKHSEREKGWTVARYCTLTLKDGKAVRVEGDAVCNSFED